ncbi:MAG: hypothetical protein C4531_05670 [Desulfurivibrio sp.]|nr:MAG: hypothetical protein C4531_05670 [Desulfurivibrio sp.]
MKRFAIYSFPLAIFFAAFFLLSCSAKKQQPVEETKAPVAIASLVVLPAETERQDKADYATTRQLEEGAATINVILQEMLADKKNILLLTANQKESLLADFSGNPQATARYIGQQLGVDAVMLTVVSRYSERDGGDYSVNQPASVFFKYQLIHVPTGTTLCLGVFDETQQTLLSNLFSFSKASSRGFKWVKAEQLAREGLQEKLSDCQYLAQ